MVDIYGDMNFLTNLTEKELHRQKNTLNLIASENYPSTKVLDLMGSVWMNKYGEGYPRKRYYAGNENTDKLELFVQNKALEVFDTTGEYGVNVQVLSGSSANMMVYLSCLGVGDNVMSLSLANGGHLSHLHSTNSFSKFFKHIQFDVVETENNTFEIDVEGFETQLKTHQPKLVIIGFSAFPKRYSCKVLTTIAHRYGALVLADIAHINGLIAANLHDTPFDKGEFGADFVTMTTHKTLRGPRGAMVFAKKELMESLNKTIFPGTSGGPHFNQIAAIGQCLLEILGEDQYPDGIDFATYSKQVLVNTKIIENTLKSRGLEIISPTETHLCLVKLPNEMDSLEIQKRLEQVGIITNRNMIPFDTKTAWRPSGLRLGGAALTSRGMTEVQAEMVGNLIADTIFEKQSQEITAQKVLELTQNLNWWI
jgi:glycine hydroxymethyltransferase